MEKVCVCSGCGRTIESDFIYCPWCGNSRLKKNDEDVLEAMFKNLEMKQNQFRLNRIEKMEKELAQAQATQAVEEVVSDLRKKAKINRVPVTFDAKGNVIAK